MMRRIYDNVLSQEQRARVKHAYYSARKMVADYLFAYDKEKLRNVLLQLGIEQGDTLFVHSSFSTFNGFQGSPQDVINCLINVLGENGNLLMPSMQYRSSSYEHLQKNEPFDVRKTFSKMGLITEVFRRKKGVLRSLHPTHAILALGKDAARIVDGHEKCIYPCGKHTPFDKFRSLNGKVLFFDVTFNTFTFIHHIEDLIKNELPFPLYRKDPIAANMLDNEGREIKVSTYVFSDEAVRRRRPVILETYLLKKHLIRKERIGMTALMLVSAEDAIRCSQEMLAQKIFFYEEIDLHV